MILTPLDAMTSNIWLQLRKIFCLTERWRAVTTQLEVIPDWGEVATRCWEGERSQSESTEVKRSRPLIPAIRQT